MKPLRKHVAISIDGGGIKGVMVTRALMMLEEYLDASVHDTFRLAAGTSTGAIIAAGIAAGLSAARMHTLYTELGSIVFPQTLRSRLWPLTRYRYASEALERLLYEHIGEGTLGDFWTGSPPTDLVITTFDVVEQHTRFLKPWKPEYAGWPIARAVLASSSVPTYFPVVEGRYVDGGIGSYANPSYLAAYEARFCLGWPPAETTLISFGTGRDPHHLEIGEADRWYAWQWLAPVLGAFGSSSDDQQIHLVDTFFEDLDFRRFQVDFREPIRMDDVSKVPELIAYGDELGAKMLRDEVDWPQQLFALPAPRRAWSIY